MLLTEDERNRLFKDYGESETMEAIKFLDEYLQSHQKKIKEYSDHNLVLRNWVFNAVKEKEQRESRIQNGGNRWKPQTEKDFFGGIIDFMKED